jgi:hypothetical protein
LKYWARPQQNRPPGGWFDCGTTCGLGPWRRPFAEACLHPADRAASYWRQGCARRLRVWTSPGQLDIFFARGGRRRPDVSLLPELIPAAIAAAIVGLSEAATVGAAYPNPKRADRGWSGLRPPTLCSGWCLPLPAGRDSSGGAALQDREARTKP